MNHAHFISSYSDFILLKAWEDLKSRNLANYRDHHTRWTGQRLSALTKEKNRRGLAI